MTKKLVVKSKTYAGKEATQKFVEHLAKISIIETPMYPFKAGKIQYFNPTDKKYEFGYYRFSKEDIELIKKAIGSFTTSSLPELRAFLTNKCNVQNPTDYSWPDILAALRLKLNSTETKTTATRQPQPNDLISLLVAVKDYSVSRGTLKRMIKDGRLKSYRGRKAHTNSPHFVSRAAIEKFYTKKG